MTTGTPLLAPYAAIDAIKAAVALPFEAGSAVERELFADCLMSTESRALVHLFFAEREAAKVPGVPRNTPVADVQRGAIVGAGTMGGGIAMTYANAGIPVLLKDVDDAALARGMAAIRTELRVVGLEGQDDAGGVRARDGPHHAQRPPTTASPPRTSSSKPSSKTWRSRRPRSPISGG